MLRDCGYEVIIGDEIISEAMDNIKHEPNQQRVLDWIIENKVTHIGISYRLDEDEAVNMVGYLMNRLKGENMLYYQGGPIKSVIFAGLPHTCEVISKVHKGFIKTFKGGESVAETLSKMGVPKERIPRDILEGSQYDDLRMEFGKEIIKSHKYDTFKPVDRATYEEYGTFDDTVEKRLNAQKQAPPLFL